MKKIILSTRKLCKSYAHNGEQNHILSQVDIDIYDGDFTIIMGASGSGKSTLLYSLSGMDRVTAGEVVYKGENIVKFSENKLAALRHNDFGFVFQQMHLISNLSIFENIAVPGYLNKKSANEVNKRADMLIQKMGLSKIKTHLPSQTSGGEQQRAAISRAVINLPVLLFADEPTGALNRKNTIEVLNLLTNMNKEGQSILMVTHDMRAALRATRILYLEDGNISGELTLPPFDDTEEKSRETQVNAWLSSMEW
ncbi:ABC transporter ATP-binding protein [Sedimentibacter sp. zth1]|uniref:ABC transporter ATP-binding protein n=1 Tax=Sedimentibacter sp. zth1 TaxID=2816908 RepID=UPI001A92E671|nr:ABC transporter ATP-binding protein [Sedimentibacter sp. zth1]QSX05700.1 ABC transporter ATP-binding protein [Sedimentibacter sp. zth1]